jgi:hypothetical protein
MKRNALNILLAVIVFALAFACDKKQTQDDTNSEANDSKEWKEMDDFHFVMAEAFHPYKDSSNLAPAKSKAGELVASADKWASAPLPERVDNDEMKTKLQQLKSQAEALRDIVQSGKDEEIGTQLTALHDTFHEVQEMWYQGHDGHEKHEHAHH